MRAILRLQSSIGVLSDAISYSASRLYNPCRRVNANHASRKVLELSQRCASNSPVYDNSMSHISVNARARRAEGHLRAAAHNSGIVSRYSHVSATLISFLASGCMHFDQRRHAFTGCPRRCEQPKRLMSPLAKNRQRRCERASDLCDLRGSQRVLRNRGARVDRPGGLRRRNCAVSGGLRPLFEIKLADSDRAFSDLEPGRRPP